MLLRYDHRRVCSLCAGACYCEATKPGYEPGNEIILAATPPTIDSERQRVAIPQCARASLGHLLRSAVPRLSTENQGIIWRTFATIVSSAIDTSRNSCQGNNATQLVTTNVTESVQVTEAVLTMAIMVLLLFIICRLSSVSHPFGKSSGSTIFVDVLGEAVVCGLGLGSKSRAWARLGKVRAR